jgi:hypothetical protein
MTTPSLDNARLRPHLRPNAGTTSLGTTTIHTHTTHTVGHGSAGGDPRQLRGIPAIGRTVNGAIAGTQPERREHT